MPDNSINNYAVEAEQIHLPPRSVWPLALSVGVGLLPFALIAWSTGHAITAELLGISGAAVTLVSLMGWAHAVIRDKREDVVRERVSLQQEDLKLFLKYFLLSEAAIFGGLFVHYFYTRYHLPFWPPDGSPEVHTRGPALATLILMFSSFTCEMGHRAIEKGKKFSCKSWLLVTAALGLLFLGYQGYEWGLLLTHYDFTVETNIFGTMFYMLTGFHGFHVSVGIIFLLLTYGRLELGQMNENRHFSVIATSWYWHFVDVVWVLLFFSLYLI